MIQVFHTEDHYILQDGDFTLWCSRTTGALEPKKGDFQCISIYILYMFMIKTSKKKYVKIQLTCPIFWDTRNVLKIILS